MGERITPSARELVKRCLSSGITDQSCSDFGNRSTVGTLGALAGDAMALAMPAGDALFGTEEALGSAPWGTLSGGGGDAFHAFGALAGSCLRCFPSSGGGGALISSCMRCLMAFSAMDS